VLYLTFEYLQIIFSFEVQIAFLVVYGIQRIPLIYLSFAIFFDPNIVGPTKNSRVLLVIAMLIYLACDIPLEVWAYFLPNQCVFIIASFVDIINIFHLVALILFFVFLRLEYIRNSQECIWKRVNDT